MYLKEISTIISAYVNEQNLITSLKILKEDISTIYLNIHKDI
jgi:hypothetical protein